MLVDHTWMGAIFGGVMGVVSKVMNLPAKIMLPAMVGIWLALLALDAYWNGP